MRTQDPSDPDGESPGASERDETGRAEDEPDGVEPVLEPDTVIEPTARFVDPTRQRPQRYSSGQGQLPPTRPLDPIQPYMPPRVSRRRRSDWPVLVFALVIACLFMAGCCVAGFALYSGYGNPFAK